MSDTIERIINEYRYCILNAFPKNLKMDVYVVLDIIPFQEKINVENEKTDIVPYMISINTSNFYLEGELLSIPNRIYFIEPEEEKEKKLNEIQSNILNSIYLRHHNGFVRQKRLELLSEQSEIWIIPFKIHLLGEYVIEILEILDHQISYQNLKLYHKFINENTEYWKKIESRVISYWNEYYRDNFPEIKDYVGYQIINRINDFKTA